MWANEPEMARRWADKEKTMNQTLRALAGPGVTLRGGGKKKSNLVYWMAGGLVALGVLVMLANTGEEMIAQRERARQ